MWGWRHSIVFISVNKKNQKHTKPPDVDGIVVESLDAAAAMTGYTREALQSWKRAGCPAFKPGNRIHLDEIAPWLADNPEVTRASNPALTLTQIETRGHLLKQANEMQKLSERRKLFTRGEDAKRSTTRAFMALKIKLLGMSSKMAQPLALLTDARDVQKNLDAEIMSILGQLSRGEWFDAEIAERIEKALK